MLATKTIAAVVAALAITTVSAFAQARTPPAGATGDQVMDKVMGVVRTYQIECDPVVVPKRLLGLLQDYTLNHLGGVTESFMREKQRITNDAIRTHSSRTDAASEWCERMKPFVQQFLNIMESE